MSELKLLYLCDRPQVQDAPGQPLAGYDTADNGNDAPIAARRLANFEFVGP